METPFLYGGGEAHDANEQEVKIFKIRSRHLTERERATELSDLKFRTVVHGCGKTIVVDKEKNSGEKNHKETTNRKRTLFYVRETLENVIRHEEKQNDAIAQ